MMVYDESVVVVILWQLSHGNCCESKTGLGAGQYNTRQQYRDGGCLDVMRFTQKARSSKSPRT